MLVSSSMVIHSKHFKSDALAEQNHYQKERYWANSLHSLWHKQKRPKFLVNLGWHSRLSQCLQHQSLDHQQRPLFLFGILLRASNADPVLIFALLAGPRKYGTAAWMHCLLFACSLNLNFTRNTSSINFAPVFARIRACGCSLQFSNCARDFGYATGARYHFLREQVLPCPCYDITLQDYQYRIRCCYC